MARIPDEDIERLKQEVSLQRLVEAARRRAEGVMAPTSSVVPVL